MFVPAMRRTEMLPRRVGPEVPSAFSAPHRNFLHSWLSIPDIMTENCNFVKRNLLTFGNDLLMTSTSYGMFPSQRMKKARAQPMID
jgi:hypothetical protein